MSEWLKRFSEIVRAQPDSEQLAPAKKILANLAKLDNARDEQAQAARIVRAFAEVSEKSSEQILDAKKLPFPKNVIRAALDRRIVFFEKCCEQEPEDSTWKKDAERHRTVRLYLSDFQEIDPEDEAVVQDANAGRLDNFKFGLLFLKYHQRSMKENGMRIDEPLELEAERISFDDLWRRGEQNTLQSD